MGKRPKIILIFCVFAVLLLKIFYFNFYSVSNDDNIYFTLSRNIFQFHRIEFEGISDYSEMPPGYPVILGIERLVFGDNDSVLFFNFVVITTLTSLLLIIFYKRNFPGQDLAVFFPLALFLPIFTTANYLLGASSEYIYTFLIWLGLFLLFEYIFRGTKKLYLFCLSLLFSICYLIRPEGLLFLATSFLIIIFFRRRKFTIGDSIVFLIPIFLFVIPYMVFLYKTLGHVTISGKLDFINNLTKGFFADRVNLYLNNVKDIFKILFIRPNFINPLISLCLVYFVFIFRRLERDIKVRLTVLLIFPALTLIIFTRYLIWARAVYPLLPAFVIISGLCLNDIFRRRKFSREFLSFPLSLYLIICAFVPLLGSDSYNHPFLYRRAGIFIKNNFGKDKLIMGRSNLYIHAEGRPLKFQAKIAPDFIVISNLTHQFLRTIERFEIVNASSGKVAFNDVEFVELRRFGNAKYFVKVFTRDKPL